MGATEAARAMMRFGFAELGVHRIWAECVADNVASARVLDQLGMRREARFREHQWARGRWWDTLIYAILDHEWRLAQPQRRRGCGGRIAMAVRSCFASHRSWSGSSSRGGTAATGHQVPEDAMSIGWGGDPRLPRFDHRDRGTSPCRDTRSKKGLPVRHLLVIVCAMAMLEIGSSAALAQPATPASNVPDPTECQVAPKPGALLRGSPTADAGDLRVMIGATPVAASLLPSGKPVDRETIAALNATVRGLIGCVNAVDRERIYSYFSDDFPASGLYVLGLYNLYAFNDPTTPLPPEGRLPMSEVADARLLLDGRAGALLSAPAGEPTIFLFFVPSNDPTRPPWLIDGVIAVDGT